MSAKIKLKDIVTTIVGYTKSATNRALSATDDILTAIGVLEKKADDNTSSITSLQSSVVNASNLTTGTVADARLSSNVGLLNGVQIFAASKSFATGTDLSLYNTADQNTNYERARQYWGSNAFNIAIENGGTGSGRTLKLLTGNSAMSLGTTGLAGSVQLSTGASSANMSGTGFIGTYSQSSGVANSISILNTINQTSSAGYRGLWISPFEQATGSGNKYLIDAGTNSAANGGGTHTSKFNVDNNGKATFYNTITAAGTTGAQTINKPTGTVNLAAGTSTITVTNSLVTTSSIVYCVIRTNDATAKIRNVVPAAGSFTITLDAAATAETSVGFIVFN